MPSIQAKSRLWSRLAACVAALTLIVMPIGCGERSKESAKSPAGMVMMKGAQAPAQAADQAEPGEPVNVQNDKQDKGAPPPLEKVKRKIKYTADLSFITEDFPKTESALLDLIDANNGFVSNADVSARPGQPRFGVWTVRVPVERFEEFRRALSKIGELESSKVKTDDVTAQFYDLENDVKNKKSQEDALRELLKRQTDKIENLLTVQRELSNVRNSIERAEGQIRLLANLTDLTTVTVHVNERRKFVPDAPPEAAEKPTFGARVGKTFSESWQGFVEVVQNVAIAVVAVTPWLPLLAVVGGAGWYLVRRWRTPTAYVALQLDTTPNRKD